MRHRLLIVIVWMVMTGVFLRYEAFPERFAALPRGYRDLLTRDVLVFDSWMRILFRDQPVGYSHTRVDSDENSDPARYVVENRVQMKLTFMGEPQDIAMDTGAFLNRDHQLQRFTFSFSAGDYSLNMEAEREEGNTFAVRMRAGASSSEFRADIPEDAILYSPMADLAMRQLRPGERLTLRVLEPATLSSAPIVVRAVRRETLRFRGSDRDALLLEFDYLGMTWEAWMDEAGMVLRQTTPLGFSMEQCTPEEAFAAVKGPAAPDLLTGLSVPVKGVIRHPRRVRELRLRLTGVEWAENDLETERQSVTRRGPLNLRMVVRAASLSGPGPGGRSLNEADRERYLAPTRWIQADHPDIRRQAQRLVSGRTSPLDQAVAICDWVHGSVAKDYRATLPSALDVLRTMAGDCNEHTYLFVALARAAGLPARVHVGLAYQDGAFYYHAWAGVFVGHWLEMDPTWGQHAVDATHITLAEGELGEQLSMARVMGRLRIEVEEESYGEDERDGSAPDDVRGGSDEVRGG